MFVKQGGVLSPILFAIYTDELLKRLEETGVGCHMGSRFAGALAYADDITLLAPCKSALSILVSVCEKYASEFDILFNSSKSKLLFFKGRFSNEIESGIIIIIIIILYFRHLSIYTIKHNYKKYIHTIKVVIRVNGELVNISDNAVHLGHTISSSDRESISLTAKSSFWKSFNSFISNFGHTYSFIKCSLFKQFCCSFYGSLLWNLNGPGVQSLCVDWRKSLRSLWRVHPMTHCDVIAALSDQFPIKVSLERRFIRFIKKCLSSSNSIVNVFFSDCNMQSNVNCW